MCFGLFLHFIDYLMKSCVSLGLDQWFARAAVHSWDVSVGSRQKALASLLRWVKPNLLTNHCCLLLTSSPWLTQLCYLWTWLQLTSWHTTVVYFEAKTRSFICLVKLCLCSLYGIFLSHCHLPPSIHTNRPILNLVAQHLPNWLTDSD